MDNRNESNIVRVFIQWLLLRRHVHALLRHYDGLTVLLYYR
jgi:uncharacterized protein YjiS (DUF1127 family)